MPNNLSINPLNSENDENHATLPTLPVLFFHINVRQIKALSEKTTEIRAVS
jgi:hypothetical protein